MLQFPIVDPQMHARSGYSPYDTGIQENIFIKDVTGQPFNGQVPMTLFPLATFTDSHASQLVRLNPQLYRLMAFDGACSCGQAW
jgi:hypothetical protein